MTVKAPGGPRWRIPAVGKLLELASVRELSRTHGHDAVVQAIRHVQSQLRARADAGEQLPPANADGTELLDLIESTLQRRATPSLRRVLNLTGTVLHTNLGRARLPAQAVDAMVAIATDASNLEFGLESGKRGDRDSHLETLLCELTGAEAATVVNNNAAAVMLTVNSLALRKEVLISRGELVEIGGTFRIPDVMARAGGRLREVGTTNRTHLSDFAQGIGPRSAMIMKVHPSNFSMQGFVTRVPEKALADLAHAHGIPFVVDLGSGTLLDLERYGLPHEATPMDSLRHGADLVTFSGDKLLGGPQAGIVIGRRSLIDRIRRNPMKRALRLDKLTVAALHAVLDLYRNPDSLALNLPTLRLLTRGYSEIRATGQRLFPFMQETMAPRFQVELVDCESMIGSGSLPASQLPSVAFAIRPVGPKRHRASVLSALGAALRGLPVPIIGRIHQDALLLDLRCLEPPDEVTFRAQLQAHYRPPQAD